MKQFKQITNKTYSFSSCSTCEAMCCDGRKGSLFAQIILDDFKEIYNNFPIVFIYGELGYLKPVVILSNGKDFCPYNKNLKCTVYENRPSICKTYPLSPHLDNQIYIDESCPAINDEKGNIIIKNLKLIDTSSNDIFDNYQNNYLDTHFEFENTVKKEDFEIVIKLQGVVFYKYTKDSKNKYLKMHQNSLIHLDTSYFKD